MVCRVQHLNSGFVDEGVSGLASEAYGSGYRMKACPDSAIFTDPGMQLDTIILWLCASALHATAGRSTLI